MIVIDGTNTVLGRLASAAAKELLKGESVHIANAEKVIITGNRLHITGEYLEKRRIGSPHHGPFFPTRPDMIVRRCVRGMMPYKTNKGREAFKRLKVTIGAAGAGEMKRIQQKAIRTSFVTVGDVAEALGWRK